MKQLVFEHPLSEKMRNYLRLENLFIQLDQIIHLDDIHSHQLYFKTLFDLKELFDRADWRRELNNDLEKQKDLLKKWLNSANTNNTKIVELIDKINEITSQLLENEQLSFSINQDKFLSSLRQRFSLPGATFSFDLPQLHFWLSLDFETKRSDMIYWIQPYQLLKEAIYLYLDLIREQSGVIDEIAKNGVYNGTIDNCKYIQIMPLSSHNYYPIISGYNGRFAIKFMHYDEENIIEDIEFRLAYYQG